MLGRKWGVVLGVLFLFVLAVGAVSAQQPSPEIKEYADAMKQGTEGMTVLQMLQSGGGVMAILFTLSIITIALAVYCLITLRESDLIPSEFCNKAIQSLAAGKHNDVKAMCDKQKNNIIARIMAAGLDKFDQDPVFAKETIEQKARNEINTLWRRIGYFSDIATIAPLLGLLGTVLGMIKAFNVIAFQTGGVKPMLLAGGVAQAMITTAGGIVVALPAVIFYSYFRRKVQQIADNVEMYYIDMIRFME